MIEHTNIDDDNMSILYLVKNGYGSVLEIRDWDTEQFLDALEYESIGNAITRHFHWKSEQK